MAFMLLAGLFHILRMDVLNGHIEKHRWQKQEGGPIKDQLQ